jgi:hypothetical protein
LTQALRGLFCDETVVDLAAIRQVLGGVSAMTAFRYLREVDYRRSYNRNGRFYTLFVPSRFDRWGLWGWKGVYFSVDGSLRETTRRMVFESEQGTTQRELQDRLQVRVQNTLADLLRKSEVGRERVGQVFVYVHVDAEGRQGQLRRRRELMEAAAQAAAEVSDEVVIQVLLQLIRHPGSRAADVARRLRRRSPPITFAQVEAVFSRYRLGQKGGLHSLSS